MGGVLELAEEPGDDEGDLLADVDGVVADPLERACDEHHRHRPLAGVVVIADLDREVEDLLVEIVDDVVLADEVAGEGDVAALVLWVAAAWSGSRSGTEYTRGMDKAKELLAAGQTGPSAELGALNRTRDGVVMHTVTTLAVALIAVDMIWKPGA